jgi:hypothetical protein
MSGKSPTCAISIVTGLCQIEKDPKRASGLAQEVGRMARAYFECDRQVQSSHRRGNKAMERAMAKQNDLSRCLVTLEQDATVIAVIEIGQKRWPITKSLDTNRSMIDTDRPIQVPSSELPWPIAMAEISRHLRRGLVQRSHVVILAALALAAVDAFDLSFALRTGRARGAIRHGHPQRTTSQVLALRVWRLCRIVALRRGDPVGTDFARLVLTRQNAPRRMRLSD